MRIEGSPFTGWFTSFGGQSTDSVVGLLESGNRWERERNVCSKQVIKWNRHDFASETHAVQAGEFKERSIALYQAALGEEYIVPTQVIVGQKKDQNGVKHKVFQLQPLIAGVTAKDAPTSLREDEAIINEWQVLSERLFTLYTLSLEINTTVPEEERFPITMTIGSSRQNAEYLTQSEILPKTKNILLEEPLGKLRLFDFGAYTLWHDGMIPVYEALLNHKKFPDTGVIFSQKGEGTPEAGGVV